jgi:hypothetical protein
MAELQTRFRMLLVAGVFFAGWFIGCSGATDPMGALEVVSPDGVLQVTTQPGEAVVAEVVLRNSGEGPISVVGTPQAAWLQLSPTHITIPADAVASMAVAAHCSSVGVQHGVIGFSSEALLEDLLIEVSLECEIVTGDLEVELEGLPEGLDGAVTVTGPEEFHVDLGSTALLEGLVPGTYQVSASVVGDEIFFLPTESPIVQQVVGGELAHVHVEYTVVTGTLRVVVVGLPPGAPPALLSVVIDGDGDSVQVPIDGEIEALLPGTHLLVGADVEHSGSLYQALDVEIAVVSDQITNATIEYAIAE